MLEFIVVIEDDWEPGPKTQELLEVLHVLIDLLRRAGDAVWLEELLKARRWIRNSDYSGILAVLGFFDRKEGGFDEYGSKRLREVGDNLNPPVSFAVYQRRMYQLAKEIKAEVQPKRYLKKSRPWRK